MFDRLVTAGVGRRRMGEDGEGGIGDGEGRTGERGRERGKRSTGTDSSTRTCTQ